MAHQPPTEAQQDAMKAWHMALDSCHDDLRSKGLPVTAPDDGSIWCNATFDTIMCWPATPANSTAHKECPPIKGLDATMKLEKHCHWSGAWAGRNRSEPSLKPFGYTDFRKCMPDEIRDMINRLGTQENLEKAQLIARNTRILEFIGLSTSFLTLMISVVIFCSFRRLHVFRCLLHLQLCVAILCMVTCRLLLYVDLYTVQILNTAPFLCEFFYFALEYFKTVAFAWTFLEGFYLHSTIVLSVFNSTPSMLVYTAIGYGVPFIHCMVWFITVCVVRQKVENCLGNYYMHPEYYVLDVPRMLELAINFGFLVNVLRVLWSKVSESYHTSETEKIRKSVKAALMLIPLLGLPNITQTIPFSPTKDNLPMFEVWMYFSSFLYMFQGAMIAVLYCFINREVQHVVCAVYQQHKMAKMNTNSLNKPTKSSTRQRLRDGVDSGKRSRCDVDGIHSNMDSMISGSALTNQNHQLQPPDYGMTVANPQAHDTTPSAPPLEECKPFNYRARTTVDSNDSDPRKGSSDLLKSGMATTITTDSLQNAADTSVAGAAAGIELTECGGGGRRPSEEDTSPSTDVGDIVNGRLTASDHAERQQLLNNVDQIVTTL